MSKYDKMTIEQIVRAVSRLTDVEIVKEIFEYPDVYRRVNEYKTGRKRIIQNKQENDARDNQHDFSNG